jgi:hypothetical protein
MYSRSFTAIRLLLLPAFIWAGFVAYGYSLEALGDIIPTPKEGSFVVGTLLARGFLAAAVISILFCYPLALLYRKSAVTVAMVMSLPVLMLRLPELMAFDRHPIAIAISAYGVLTYGVLLVVGARLAHSHLSSSKMPTMAIRGGGEFVPSVKPDAPQ